MKCPKCGGCLEPCMIEDIEGIRCLNCGLVDDHTMRLNRANFRPKKKYTKDSYKRNRKPVQKSYLGGLE